MNRVINIHEKSMLNIFTLEKHLIPYKLWDQHKDKVPKDGWRLLEQYKDGGPVGLGYMEDTGYYVIASGQGPFMVWMEKQFSVTGPYGTWSNELDG